MLFHHYLIRHNRWADMFTAGSGKRARTEKSGNNHEKSYAKFNQEVD